MHIANSVLLFKALEIRMNVNLSAEAQGQLIALPPTINARLRKVFKRMEAWPNVSGAKPLTGPLAGQYRMRTGDYRVQFVVLEDRILVVKVGHRDGFYDE